MTELNFKTVTHHRVHINDLEQFFNKIYNTNIYLYDLVFEPNQNTFEDIIVDGESEFDDIDDDYIYQQWVDSGKTTGLEPSYCSPSTDKVYYRGINLTHVMHRLFLDNHIPAGQWMIEISW